MEISAVRHTKVVGITLKSSAGKRYAFVARGFGYSKIGLDDLNC
jgi:hypothetical protein